MQFSLTAFLLLFTTALPSLAAPAAVVDESSAVVERAPGPSGTLTYPPGGTKFAYQQHGNLHLSYSQVSTPTAQTLAIDVVLKATDIHHGDKTLVTGLSVNSKTAPITAWFAYPDLSLSICAKYQLQITEWQLHNNQIISFVAAAPTISINC